MASTIKKAVLAASIALISFNAQATLTSYNTKGVDVVYSSVSNVTWLKDANLFSTLAASKGIGDLFSEIYAVSPTVNSRPNIFNSFTGINDVRVHYFMPNGEMSWFGAMAFVNYLNSINYGGVNKWRLPTNTSGIIINNNTDATNAQNGTSSGNEFAELFYSELGGTWGKQIPDPNNIFKNEKIASYWTESEYIPNPNYAWQFYASGGQGPAFYSITTSNYTWIIADGKVAAVPEPENLAMLLGGLGLIGLAKRRNKKA